MYAVDSTDSTGEDTLSFHKTMVNKPSASLSEYPEGWFWDDDWVRPCLVFKVHYTAVQYFQLSDAQLLVV